MRALAAAWLLTLGIGVVGAAASEVRYRGRDATTGRGIVQLDSGWFVEAAEGERLPDGRRVRAVMDEELVVERPLDEAERQALRGAERIMPDVAVTAIPRSSSAPPPPLR